MKCELLKIQQVIGEATVQATISEALRVPEEKPGVEQVVSVDGTVRIRRIEIIEDKIIVHGRLHVGVVYVAFKDPQPVHYTHEGIEFTQFADLPGALPGMTARVKVKILDIQGECGDRRGFGPDHYGIVAVLELHVKVTQTQEVNVLVEPDTGVQATTQRVRVEEIVAEAEQENIIEGRFKVPEEKPGVDRILDVAAEIFITETKIIDDQALIEGDAIMQVMYVAFKDSQPVHHMHHRLHFTQFVPLPGLPVRHRDLHVHVDEMVEYIGYDAISPDTIKVELFLKKVAIVTKTRDIDIVTAITDSTAPNYQTACLSLEQVIGEASTQALIKEELRIPEEKPGAQQVLDVKIIRVRIPHEDVVVINDKVILSGVIHLKVVYVAFLENQPVHAMEAKVKFRSFIPIPGCLPEMTALVNAIVEHATAFTREPDLINVEIILQLTGRVVQAVCIDVVLCPAAAVPPPPVTAPTCPPGAVRTTVTVQPGDTIFKYALQYHVSMDHIIAANPGIDPNNLVVGSTINIPCDPS
jgi:LysM repeat protein